MRLMPSRGVLDKGRGGPPLARSSPIPSFRHRETASPLSERPLHKHELREAVTLAASPGLILDIANQTRTLIVCPWKEQTAFTRILSGIHQDSQPPQAHFTQFVGELPDVAHQDLKKLSVGFAARDLDAAIAGRHHVRG